MSCRMTRAAGLVLALAAAGCGGSDSDGMADAGGDDAGGGGDDAGEVRPDAGERADGGDGGAVEEGTIPCGDASCVAGEEMCLACDHGDAKDAHCVARGDGDFFAEANERSEEHGCNYFTSLFIECDTTDDCAVDEECVFSGGESGYAFCAPAGEYGYGVACEDGSDCPEDAPLCGEIDPFGYFGAHVATLGWLPQACSQGT